MIFSALRLGMENWKKSPDVIQFAKGFPLPLPRLVILITFREMPFFGNLISPEVIMMELEFTMTMLIFARLTSFLRLLMRFLRRGLECVAAIADLHKNVLFKSQFYIFLSGHQRDNQLRCGASRTLEQSKPSRFDWFENGSRSRELWLGLGRRRWSLVVNNLEFE